MTSRRNFLKLGGLGALGSIASGCSDEINRESKTQSPNIIVIMADDMGYSDIGCFGGEINTPALDRLAANGLKFTQFYNTARCCPTRAALMTGLYQHQAGMGWMTYDAGIPGYQGDLSSNAVTIAEVLKQTGYRTFMSGKWHLTTHYGHWVDDSEHLSKHNWPLQRGFDRFYGIIDGTSNYFQPFSLVEDNEPAPLDMSKDYYFTDAVTDHAVWCIEDNTTGKPFFSYVAYTAPHWPLHAFPEDIAKYRGRFNEGWDVLREERFRRMVDMGIVDPEWGISERDAGIGPFDEEEYKAWRIRCMEVYAAMIDRMDQNIGRLVDTLERTGQLDNTVILFLSDNGGEAGILREGIGVKRFTPIAARDGRPMRPGNNPGIMPGPEDTYQSYERGWANLSNTPYRKYKMWVYEGGISAPLIIHWPAGIAAKGEIRRQVSHVLDLMPTCCELAGATYPSDFNGNRIQPSEGISIMPAFSDKPLDRDALFWEHEGHRAVRNGKWKLLSARDSEWELYDMEADRTERNNLAAVYPDIADELRQLYAAWEARCGVQPWSVVSKARSVATKRMDEITRAYRKKMRQ
ncbi:arylsulfatase [Candidatus Omnitrophota bacterium]